MSRTRWFCPLSPLHGATRIMSDYFVDALIARGIGVKRFDLTNSDTGDLAEATGGCSNGSHRHTYNSRRSSSPGTFMPPSSPMPPCGRNKVCLHQSALFGWGGKMLEQITLALPNLKLQFLDPVVAKGHPKEADFQGPRPAGG